MIPILMDLKTGEIKHGLHDWSCFEWAENDGSCDCNREDAFDVDSRKSRNGICVDVTGDLEGWGRDELIAEMNLGYPEFKMPTEYESEEMRRRRESAEFRATWTQ